MYEPAVFAGKTGKRGILKGEAGLKLEIVKADTQALREAFLQVLESANERMAEKGIVQWLPCHLTAEAVFTPGTEPYLLMADGTPAATVLLVTQDEVFWPEKEANSAVYLHRISVAKGFSGKGLAAAMIKFAAEYAESRGIPCLRLDCRSDREKLRRLYENCGFCFFDTIEVDVPGVHLCNARYERPLT